MGKKDSRPLTEAMFYTLMALMRGEVCGTEIAEYVLDCTAGRVKLGPGTLYTILARFLEDEYIVETAVDGRKRTYCLTDRGRAAYAEELRRLRLCLSDAEREEEKWRTK